MIANVKEIKMVMTLWWSGEGAGNSFLTAQSASADYSNAHGLRSDTIEQTNSATDTYNKASYSCVLGSDPGVINVLRDDPLRRAQLAISYRTVYSHVMQGAPGPCQRAVIQSPFVRPVSNHARHDTLGAYLGIPEGAPRPTSTPRQNEPHRAAELHSPACACGFDWTLELNAFRCPRGAHVGAELIAC